MNFNSLFDRIYDNRRFFLRYLLSALLCSLIRYAAKSPFTLLGEILAWCVFYPLCKLFVFRVRREDVFSLLKEIIIYIMAASALWFTRQLLFSLFYAAFASIQTAMLLGGAINEILCCLAMSKLVFRRWRL